MNNVKHHTQMRWWPSPAKLNLFLHITGRRCDGYHELQSVFQMLSFGDEVGIEVNPSGQINIMTPIEGVTEQANLAYKAAALLQKATHTRLGANISIRKQLPMGGGIGGGSSNAATVLCVLNQLWQCGLDPQSLCKLGLTLGADVPVFIHGKTVFAEGVGEKFYPISLPSKWYLVANPRCHIATADVFKSPELTRNTPPIRVEDYDFGATRNDCQDLVIDRYPEVANLLQWLVHYAPSRMTGTGACVFSVFNSQSEAEETLKQLPSKWSGFVAQGLSESPLVAALSTVGQGSAAPVS
ncbi:4-(cytidine 5'-diphospho)-2-C-methyl-D-erythritol kinase [Alteromonas oceanisediminis]|uniref:4-(cytidine 5'-diphospho)-2-C-methyl-D-erythritol kinase n=1 Tax=Alteromonas oceanisediminis TaxID=2836180 RepID=UPI001BDB6B5B|nr:4-(cytidine 5'-diphospho)-2-C-methyl-D-erythritol kinase [Alteromonas oceanisediminis]MBT0587326.1 4-(cytidine 5'-diphospho)-2-C-methyl-D-erythritol kinase [Alteromonas oceanisediminis]